MQLSFEIKLNNIEKKYIKFQNNEYLIFSSFHSILERISNILKTCVNVKGEFSAVQLAKNIDLPGWLLIDLTKKSVYQDQIASLPAFFDKLNSKLYIGYPDFPEIFDRNKEYDIFGYFLTNYFENLILIGPAQTLTLNNFTLTNYFEFKRTFEEEFDLDHLNYLIENTFDNFVDLIDEQEVTVPLSGGFDSRLILDELIKRDIPLTTYSIGSIKDKDFLIAKEIANSLNIPFSSIHVNKLTLTKFIKTSDFYKFWNYSGGDFVLPHFSECMFPDKFKFLKQGSIIMPGHSLDFLAGSHLPNSKLFKNNPTRFIANYHCLQKNDFKNASSIINNYLKNNSNPLSSVELFDYEYRQSRYIVNHIRNIEYLGFKPLVPLFSFKLINYFMKLKYKDLLDRNSLLNQHKFSNNILQKTIFISAYSKSSKLKIFFKKFYFLRAIVAFIRYFTYTGKDTIYLTISMRDIFYQIFIKGCNHPLSLLRLLRKRSYSK